MTATLATKQVKDGAGTIFLQRVLDVSGTGAGPFLPIGGIADPSGNGPIDIEAQFDAVVAALQTNVSLATGTHVIGKVGLQVGGSDVAAGNPVPTRLSSPDFQASGVTAVTGSVTAAGTISAITPKAGRAAYFWLSGGTSASGYFEYSNDSGTTWFELFAEGSQLGTFSYVASGGNQAIVIPTFEQTGVQVRARFGAVSGTVSYTLSQ